MTLVAVNSTPTVCPDCNGALSMPMASKARPGMVVQTCKNLQHCGRSVWSEVGTVIVEKVVDDGRRHGRFQLPSPHEPEPRYRTKPNWASVRSIAQREINRLIQTDRKVAAAGGDR